VFSTVMLLVLLFCREMPVQAVATVATSYFTLYVIAGSVMAVSGADEHLHLFVYLVWFFPVLVFNKLVNGPTTGRWIAKVLLAVPGLLVVLLSPRLIKVFNEDKGILLAVYGLSYGCFAAMLNVATRHREEVIVERERAESLKMEAAILESISDSFVSVDAAFRPGVHERRGLRGVWG